MSTQLDSALTIHSLSDQQLSSLHELLSACDSARYTYQRLLQTAHLLSPTLCAEQPWFNFPHGDLWLKLNDEKKRRDARNEIVRNAHSDFEV